MPMLNRLVQVELIHSFGLSQFEVLFVMQHTHAPHVRFDDFRKARKLTSPKDWEGEG